ncbi:MAG TPA: ABC transporter substrate-binding protein [Gemmatimonadaceae bacterium]|nr:ABC transporter substrate-binding protein [Gemmatimonadaceae bacterium]
MSARPLIASLLCVIAGACSGGPPTIQLGVAGPFAQPYGDMNKKGIEMAIAEVNDSGGVRGKHLELDERDDGADGSKAAGIAQDFVANQGVVGVIGHVTSGAMVAAAKVYDAGRLPAIATSATTPELTGISPWVFRVITSDSSNGITIAHFASAMGRKRAAILYENDAYGRGLAASFRRSFAGQIVSNDPISATLTNAEPYIAYYKSQSPDVVFVVGTENSGLVVLHEAKREHFTSDFLGGDGWTGIVADTAMAEGAYVGTAFTVEDPRPEVQRFVSDFRARYHETPDAYAALGYDAARMMARAIQQAGPNRAAIREYLASLTDETAYHGITGVLRFGPDGDPVTSAYRMTRVHRGQFDLVAPGAGSGQ